MWQRSTIPYPVADLVNRVVSIGDLAPSQNSFRIMLRGMRAVHARTVVASADPVHDRCPKPGPRLTAAVFVDHRDQPFGPAPEHRRVGAIGSASRNTRRFALPGTAKKSLDSRAEQGSDARG